MNVSCLPPAARKAWHTIELSGKPPMRQPDGGMGVQQADRPAQIARVGHPDVVIEKDDPLPAELVAEHQGEVALGAHVGPPLEYRPGQQARGLQFGKPELGCVRNVDRDQVDLGIEVGGGRVERSSISGCAT